jgi:hypothetical protein
LGSERQKEPQNKKKGKKKRKKRKQEEKRTIKNKEDKDKHISRGGGGEDTGADVEKATQPGPRTRAPTSESAV